MVPKNQKTLLAILALLSNTNWQNSLYISNAVLIVAELSIQLNKIHLILLIYVRDA